MRLVPPYGKRGGWFPESEDDFCGGGAYPEIEALQFPLGLGRGAASKALVLQTGSDGRPLYEAIVTQHSQRQVTYSRPEHYRATFADAADLVKPSEAEQAALAAETTQALAEVAKVKAASNQVARAVESTRAQDTFVRYVPDTAAPGYNPACAERIIRVTEKKVDPLEPPKFRIRRAPPARNSPPPPILRAPAKKLTAEDHAMWKLPPCVSNWKNQKGYTIPLDMRLQADGRGLQEVSVNSKFAQFSEALYVAERFARDEIRLKNDLLKQKKQLEEAKREEQLREIAAKARAERMERLGGVKVPPQPAKAEHDQPSPWVRQASPPRRGRSPSPPRLVRKDDLEEFPIKDDVEDIPKRRSLSPRRRSESPRRRGVSPRRRRDDHESPPRRRRRDDDDDSLPRRRESVSPPRRRNDSPPRRRRISPSPNNDRPSVSPPRGRVSSPRGRVSPPRGRVSSSPREWVRPPRRDPSPPRLVRREDADKLPFDDSPPEISNRRRRESPERRHRSPERGHRSPERRRGSPERRRGSPERRGYTRRSPERRHRQSPRPSVDRRRRRSSSSDSSSERKRLKVAARVEQLERQRRREIEREFRLERAGRKRVRADQDRDISERVALGQAQPTAQDGLYDARLYSRGETGGPDITVADDDEYALYDRPLFGQERSGYTTGIYRMDKERIRRNVGLRSVGAVGDSERSAQEPVKFEKD